MKGGRFMKMKPRIAKILSLIFILAISLTMVACGGISTVGDMLGDNILPSLEIPSSEEPNQQQGQRETDTQAPNVIDLSEGTYEGKLDENGLFTGWGVWIYANLRYEGNFVDGVPNGEGTLFSNKDSHITTYQGQWVNGAAHGEIIQTLNEPQITHSYKITFDIGIPQAKTYTSIQNSEIQLIITESHCVGIYPWASFYYVNYSLQPPDGSGE